jgi:hypothetical protein
MDAMQLIADLVMEYLITPANMAALKTYVGAIGVFTNADN